MNALFAYFPSYHILSVSSVTQSCLAHCDSMDCSMPGSLSITNSQSLLKLMSFESVMPSNHLILCHPLHLPPSIFPSIMVFSNESVLHIRWPKCWSFSFSVSSSNEYSGLISFRMDWLDLLPVQVTLKSLLQHYSSKASILWCSAFIIYCRVGESEVAQLCPTLCDPVNCSPPGSSVNGIHQVRILEWVANIHTWLLKKP